LLLLALPVIALAHAKLVKSDPPDGAVLQHSPERVTAWFNDELQTSASSMEVIDAQGRPVNTGKAGVDLNDPNHTSMIAILPGALPSGRYTVRWSAASTDGHEGQHGTFAFQVQ
jgi:methionine-rich copper-binding protein CopC